MKLNLTYSISPFIFTKAMRSLSILLLFAITSCSEPSQAIQFDGLRALQYAEAQMAFGPRIPGSEASKKTAMWIIEQLEENGWEVEVQNFNHLGTPLMNITGKLNRVNGSKPIVLGAHYDTRPLADRDTINPEAPVPGANDGASGVAILLELAHVLDRDQLRQPIWLVFFDAEDSGNIDGWDWIVGSSFYADNLTQDLEAVVIVDMVGDRDLNLHIEKLSDPDLTREVWTTAELIGCTAFIDTPRYSIIDDHLPFLRKGIPAIDIIDFDYPYFHTLSDTIDKISADSLEQVGRTLEHWLENQR